MTLDKYPKKNIEKLLTERGKLLVRLGAVFSKDSDRNHYEKLIKELEDTNQHELAANISLEWEDYSKAIDNLIIADQGLTASRIALDKLNDPEKAIGVLHKSLDLNRDKWQFGNPLTAHLYGLAELYVNIGDLESAMDVSVQNRDYHSALGLAQ